MEKSVPKEAMIIYETVGQPAVFIMSDRMVRIDLKNTDHSSENSTYEELKVLISGVEDKIELIAEEFTELYRFFLKYNFYQKWSLELNEYNHLKIDKYYECLTIKMPELSHTIMESDELSLASTSSRQVFQLFIARIRMFLTKAEQPELYQLAMKI